MVKVKIKSIDLTATRIYTTKMFYRTLVTVKDKELSPITPLVTVNINIVKKT